MVKRLKNYVGGRFVEADAQEYLPVYDPATCEILAEVPDSSRADVDRAVGAAARAQRQSPAASRAPIHLR